MRRPSSIEPFTPASTVTLHPLLQAALDNLDVKVEEELTRYRRQRRYPDRTLPRPTSRQISQPVSRPSLSLPLTQPPVQASAPVAERPSVSSPIGNSVRFAAPAVQPIREQVTVIQANTPQANIAQPDAPVESAHAISSYAEYADLSAYAPSTTLQKLMHQADSETAGPSDYLASSEELLRSIAEEDPELRAEREPNALLDTLLTPLGIGSMLLLLMSSTMLGYVVMNPASVGLGNDNAQSAASDSNRETVEPIATDRSIVPSPDLASEEFVDLDLNTLSTLPKKSAVAKPSTAPNAKASPKAGSASGSTSAANRTAAPASSSRSSSNTGSITAPEPQPRLSTVVIPSAPPVVSVPEPAIAPAAPAPVSPEPISTAPLQSEPIAPSTSAPSSTAASEPAPARSPSYYVVTEYSGDPSLQEARTVVPDAYVRNLPSEGAKVQLGAFSDEAKAQELQQQLREQGIEAEVYQP